MYKQAPEIETASEALDELADVRMTLSGLASLTLALANSGMHEPDAMRLISCLVDQCARSSDMAIAMFQQSSSTRS